jgi:hypothetical protein
MTNRQWLIWELIDMSDEELVKNLWSQCELCTAYVKQNKPCPGDCDSLWLAWLKQEHEDD